MRLGRVAGCTLVALGLALGTARADGPNDQVAKPADAAAKSAELPPPGLAPMPAGISAPILKSTASDDDHPSNYKVAGWVGVAVTLAVLTTGAIFGLSAQERSDEISRQQIGTMPNGQPVPFTMALEQQITSLRSDGQLFNTAGIALMSASAATAIASAILFVIDGRQSGHETRSDAPHVRLLPSLSPVGGGMAASVEF